MTTYYCNPDETYDGDGSSTASAASDGAAGAANDLQGVCTGTHAYITLASYDLVIIKAVSTGTDDLTLDIEGHFDFAPNFANFEVDTAGNHFTADSNTTVTIGFTGTLYALNSGIKGFTFVDSTTEAYRAVPAVFHGGLSTLENCTLYTPKITSGTETRKIYLNYYTSNANYVNCLFDIGHISVANKPVFSVGGYFKRAETMFVGCTFDLSRCTGVNYSYLFVGRNYAYSHVEMHSCNLVGGDLVKGIASGTYLPKVIASGLRIDDYSCLAPVNNGIAGDISSEYAAVSLHGIDGKFGFWEMSYRGESTWRDENFPYFGALLPDKSTGWSIRCLPGREVKRAVPFFYPALAHYNTLTDAARTVTLHLCTKDGVYDLPKDDEFFIRVQYQDSSGDIHNESSVGSGSTLTADTVTWVPETGGKVVYGANDYTKYKIALTTSNDVAQDSIINVTMTSLLPSSSDSDFYFFDPKVEVV